MVKFWSHSGMLTVNSRMYFIKVMESGTEEKTTISAGKSISMIDLVELNHVAKTVTVFGHDSSLEYVIEWAKQLYHTYFQEGDKVVHNEYGVGKIEKFYNNEAYVHFNKIGNERNVDCWVLTENLTKMK